MARAVLVTLLLALVCALPAGAVAAGGVVVQNGCLNAGLLTLCCWWG